MSKALEELEKIKKLDILYDIELTEKGEEYMKSNDIDLSIIEKSLKALNILKVFNFEIEDYTEEEYGSVNTNQRRIILDDDEIDLLKEVLR